MATRFYLVKHQNRQHPLVLTTVHVAYALALSCGTQNVQSCCTWRVEETPCKPARVVSCLAAQSGCCRQADPAFFYAEAVSGSIWTPSLFSWGLSVSIRPHFASLQRGETRLCAGTFFFVLLYFPCRLTAWGNLLDDTLTVVVLLSTRLPSFSFPCWEMSTSQYSTAAAAPSR